MSTPTKPERVEAGPMAAKGDGDPVACLSCGGPLPPERSYVCKKACCFPDVFYCYGWRPLRDAWNAGARDFPRPATPGTATVTPAPGQRWRDEWDGREIIIGERLPTSNGRWRWALLDNPGCGYLEHYFTDGRLTYLGPGPASKPPAYGRLVGELRAPDGTPRTALEAIQATRKPEPWVESCDLLHWLRDA